MHFPSFRPHQQVTTCVVKIQSLAGNQPSHLSLFHPLPLLLSLAYPEGDYMVKWLLEWQGGYGSCVSFGVTGHSLGCSLCLSCDMSVIKVVFVCVRLHYSKATLASGLTEMTSFTHDLMWQWCQCILQYAHDWSRNTIYIVSALDCNMLF